MIQITAVSLDRFMVFAFTNRFAPSNSLAIEEKPHELLDEREHGVALNYPRYNVS